MCELKSLPLRHLMTKLYPDLYAIHALSDKGALNIDDQVIPQPGRLHLTAERLDRTGAYLMDAGSSIYIYVRSMVSSEWVEATLGVPSYAAIPQPLYDDALPVLDTSQSHLLHNFISHLQRGKPYPAPVLILKEDNPARMLFIQRLVDDRSEGCHSYVEFLQYLKKNVK
ncbi:protein transport protein Sec24A-like [Penaeus monodon]|uniref:protein transport protein Sec24A-like n=1 Tax=Penaeus monodon TaxID=6687 RepID=UPI0018A74F54|nr:protein transport protein Sec24A-like [Penaeus monodon]